RGVVILLQLAGDALLEGAAVGVRDQRVTVRNAGPERAAEWAGEELVQVGMQQPARRQAIVGLDEDDAAAVLLPRALQTARPGQARQVLHGDLMQGRGRRAPTVDVPAGHEAVELLVL